MEFSSRREVALDGISNLRRALEMALAVEDSAVSQEVRELARAVRFAAYGAQQIGIALTDRGRVNDL